MILGRLLLFSFSVELLMNQRLGSDKIKIQLPRYDIPELNQQPNDGELKGMIAHAF